MHRSWDWNASPKANRHSIQNEIETAQAASIDELLTADDRYELREMHILPPGCAEEELYIAQHPSAQKFSEVCHEIRE